MKKQKADKLITEYLPKVYGYSITKSFHYEEAEDLCAEILCELYRSFLATDEIYYIDRYVRRICAHVYSKYVSSKKKHRGISLDGLEIPVQDDYFTEDDEQRNSLRREISFLTEVRREIVYSYYYENKSIMAISSERNLPVGTVKWHLNKARNELKEGMNMERKIGKLGIHPIKATGFGHSGSTGANNGPEFYLGDNVNLNIVYSVYHKPKTREEIAEELGITPAYLDEKIQFLEENGFLIKRAKRYTTYVKFEAETYSLEWREKKLEKQQEIAKLLANDYAQSIRNAVAAYPDVFIPSKNRELFEAAAVFYGIANKCQLPVQKDLSKYFIKTTAGGDFMAFVYLPSKPADPNYVPAFPFPDLSACGNMTRWSEKYPIYSWSIDTKHCSRKGGWENNLTSDYEYLYEWITGSISDNPVNVEKIKRLRERNFITEDKQVNIMVVKGKAKDFFEIIPTLDDATKKLFAQTALESAETHARDYPPQMRDLIITEEASWFVGNSVAVMVMDILYKNGTFKPLTEQEKGTANLLMFTERLPNQ